MKRGGAHPVSRGKRARKADAEVPNNQGSPGNEAYVPGDESDDESSQPEDPDMRPWTMSTPLPLKPPPSQGLKGHCLLLMKVLKVQEIFDVPIDPDNLGQAVAPGYDSTACAQLDNEDYDDPSVWGTDKVVDREAWSMNGREEAARLIYGAILARLYPNATAESFEETRLGLNALMRHPTYRAALLQRLLLTSLIFATPAAIIVVVLLKRRPPHSAAANATVEISPAAKRRCLAKKGYKDSILARLPRELCDEILEYTFVHDEPLEPDQLVPRGNVFSSKDGCGENFLSLQLTCKSLYRYIQSNLFMFYGRNVFKFYSLGYMLTYLAELHLPAARVVEGRSPKMDDRPAKRLKKATLSSMWYKGKDKAAGGGGASAAKPGALTLAPPRAREPAAARADTSPVFFNAADGRYGFLSYHYVSEFEGDDRGGQGKLFRTPEHYIQFRKAILFGDAKAAKRILATKNPNTGRLLGGRVENYDKDIWNVQQENIVRKLVAAIPKDFVLGIGRTEAAASGGRKRVGWGANMLGRCLSQIKHGIRLQVGQPSKGDAAAKARGPDDAPEPEANQRGTDDEDEQGDRVMTDEWPGSRGKGAAGGAGGERQELLGLGVAGPSRLRVPMSDSIWKFC
ncbi:hypothetical protein DL768_003461 [Monosporascus sp. mg162]|nr:hypothetical protein DL768_003461 [Monosporascus sp. mg162]